jgi:ankyrin repeat protein
MVKLLLANKADVNFTNFVGETPLFEAQKNDHVEAARLLIEAKADVNHRNKAGFTPLLVAARENQTEIVKLLLSDKADVNAALENGVTPLLIALNRPEVDINLVKSLLDNGADPQAHIKSEGAQWGNILPGMFALDLAIQRNRTDEMEALLAAHADANARFISYKNGSLGRYDTPLFWVCIGNSQNWAEQYKILLAHGADPDLPDRGGQTPLSLAVKNGQLDLVTQLLDHHADPNKADEKGLPPLAYSSQWDESGKIKELLLKAGANEDFQRVARIFVTVKGTGALGMEVFYRGTSAVNHFSLLETLAQAVARKNPPVDFPDYAHVAINRLKPGGGKEEIAVNLEEILASGDRSKDVPLEWGDVVQIPQMDHLLNEGSQGLSEACLDALTNCLQRHVQIIVKGQSTKLLLLPSIAPDPNRIPRPRPVPHAPFEQPAPVESTPAASPPEKTLRTFWLKEVVQQANVLLLSSDLSRVKITRNGVASQYDLAPPPPPSLRGPDRMMPGANVPPPMSYQWSLGAPGQPGGLYMLDNQSAQASSTDLWLRDGDVIEIPERDPNAPAAK